MSQSSQQPISLSLSNTSLPFVSGKEPNNAPIDVVDVGPDLAQRLSLTPGTRALLPSESLSISELLELCLPTLSSSMPSMDPELCFSNHPPTDSVAIYLSRPVPPLTFVDGLRTAAGQAMLKGKLSIVDWTCKNSTSFFSFELIEFWTVLAKAIEARRVWASAMKWLDQVEDACLDQEIREVHLILQSTPWSGTIQILRSRLTFLEMATFLSNDWLSSSQIDMALSSTALRQRESGDSQVLGRYLIGTTILSDYLHSSPVLHRQKASLLDNLSWQDYKLRAPQELQRAGNHLAQYEPDGEVIFIAYSPPGHWAAISVTSRGILEWADSLGHRPPMNLITGIRNWLNHHLSSSPFGVGNSFKCSHQTDSFSCGMIALNAIKHRIFGDALWHEEDRAHLRIREFLDIMHRCHKTDGISVRF